MSNRKLEHIGGTTADNDASINIHKANAMGWTIETGKNTTKLDPRWTKSRKTGKTKVPSLTK